MWDQLAANVFRRRYDFLDVNIGLVVGAAGALLVDSRCSAAEGAELAHDVASVTDRPVRWVVNTHWHWDHVFGNGSFPDATIWGHAAAADRLRAEGESAVADARRWFPEERRAELEEFTISPPGAVFTSNVELDVGGLVVALRYRGRGHTDGDIVVHVGDVLFAGDLVEESAPPFFGDGYPLAWPGTLAGHLGSTGTVVPGHGDVMTAGDAASQLAELEAVAAVCRRAVAEGATANAADLNGSPYPEATMRSAVARALLEASAD